MRDYVRAGAATLVALLFVGAGQSRAAEPAASSGSLAFAENAASDYDYGHQIAIPAGFGDGEFTFEFLFKADHTYPVGPVDTGANKLINWAEEDAQPYSSTGWWWTGNWLLDGHNNSAFRNGTFSLQFYGGGRLRWNFGDGISAGPGGHWAVQAWPASTTPSLLDGLWKHVTLVRRWSGVSSADLEMWINGALIASETSPARTNMRLFWDAWTGYPTDQEGWFWGAEKQAAIGTLTHYEDYKGLVDEVRFWSRAKTPVEIAADYNQPVTGAEPGLVGRFDFSEGSGDRAYDALTPIQYIQLIDMKTGYWSLDDSLPGVTHTITATAGANGTITPSGAVSVNEGASQGFTITPNSGFRVDDVLVDGQSVGAVSQYTFDNVIANHTIHATFTAIIHTITATAGLNGTISPSGAVPVNEGASQAFTIAPNSGFRIADVLVDDQSVGAVSQYTFENVIASHTITATFAPIVHTITATAGANGTISPSGTVPVNEDASQAFTITPNSGFGIADVLVDGQSVGAVSQYTFVNVIAGHTITATFAPIVHTITATAGANGTISPSGTVPVNEGASQGFTITPNSGFGIADVLVDGLSVGAVSQYTFVNVIASHTITATFAPIVHTITATAGANGLIAPSGAVPVNEGASQGFTITPNSGFRISDVLVDDQSVGAVSQYTFDNVIASHTIHATFTPIIHTITATAGLNGTISPSGAVPVNEGASQGFTISPNSGFRIADVLVDGQSVGAVSQYTFENVAANSTIHATFTAIIHTITATAGANGTISPSGAVQVDEGASQAFTITPNSGFRISDVLVDDQSAGAVSQYTFENVIASHTIFATFEPMTYTITSTSGPNGSISPSGTQTVDSGSSLSFSITADSGYRVQSIVVDGLAMDPVESYTFDNITADHTIHATFTNMTHKIKATSGSNGSISPSGKVTVAHGGPKTFYCQPDTGYRVEDVFVDDQSIGPISLYTFRDVQEDHTIHAKFTIIVYTIEASAGTGGSIDPSESIPVSHGRSKSFSIKPDSRYLIKDVLVDGQSVGRVAKYEFKDVAADHTIQALFELITYTITATAGPNGSINPFGEIPAVIGSSWTFTFHPNPHHQLAEVKVDGQSIDKPSSYTFEDVSEPHTIHAEFEPTMFTIQAIAGPNCSVDPSGPVQVMSGTSLSITIIPDAGYESHNTLIDGTSIGPVAAYEFIGVLSGRTIEVFFAPEGALLNRISRQGYVESVIEIGMSVYADTLHEYLPPMSRYLSGHISLLAQSGDGDKSDPDFLQFDIGKKSTVLIAVDPRTVEDGLPEWLRDERWRYNSVRILTNDTPSARTVYMREFRAGTVKLGPNRDEGTPTGRSMYSIIIRPENPDSAVEPGVWMKYK